MNDEKRKVLETAGWKFGDAEDFLNEGRAMNVDEAMETAAAYLAAYEQEQEPLFTAEVVAIALAAEVERLRAEIKQQNKDWCEDDEAIKQQALRVLDAAKVEGDSWSVPRMGALAEMMADEIERLRIWNKRWRDVSARLRLTLAELISEELKHGKHNEH